MRAFVAEYRVFGRQGKCRAVLATGRCFYDETGAAVHYPGMVVETEHVVDLARDWLNDLADHPWKRWRPRPFETGQRNIGVHEYVSST